MRSIIADYEQRNQVVRKLPTVEVELSGTVANEPGKAAPVPPAPQTPAGAATLSVEDMGREVAMRGRSQFLEFYYARSDEERKRLQEIAGEIRSLFPNAV
jgi:hypothetical protein